MMSSKISLSRSILSILIVFLGLLLSVVFIVYVIFSNYEMDDGFKVEDSDEFYNGYQTLRYDSSNDEYSFGMTTIFGSLEEGEYEYSKIGNGVFELVSQFGEVEYKCTGNCYCIVPEELEENDRRVAGIGAGNGVLAKGMTYLLAAVTSVVAYELAQRHFQEECVKELQGEGVCPSSSAVQSEVESCEEVISSSGDDKSTTTEDSTSSEGEKFQYRCRGRCVVDTTYDFWTFMQEEEIGARRKPAGAGFSLDFLFFWKKKEEEEKPSERRDTRDMELDKKCRALAIYGHEISVEKGEMTPREREKVAKQKFQDTVLEPYCRDNSPFETETMKDEIWEKQKVWLKQSGMRGNFHEDKIPDESPLKTWCMAEKVYSTDCRMVRNT